MVVDLAQLLARPLRKLLVDGLERVRTRLSDLRAHVLRRGYVEVVGRLRVAHRELVERADAVPEPLARYEDRRTDVEAERVVLERRSVPIAHEKADQALVGLVHLLLAAGETHARGVGDGEVGGHRVVEPDEAVVEDPNRVLRYDSVGRGHWGSESNRGTCRHFRLVVSVLEARLLSGGNRLEGVPLVLRPAVLDRRAEHDRLPPAGRGAVPKMGRADAGGIHFRPEGR